MDRENVKSCLSAFWNTFLPNNIVLVQAAGICPILAVGYNLKDSVALSVCTAVVLISINLCASLFGNRIPRLLRPALYTVLSSVLLFLAALVLQQWVSAEIYAALYLFLPLMAVNLLFSTFIGDSAVQKRPSIAAASAVGSALGFALVLCVAGALREMAAFGTLWNIPLGYEARFPEAEHPFIGYVLLGFMAAFLQWVQQIIRRIGNKKEVSSI